MSAGRLTGSLAVVALAVLAAGCTGVTYTIAENKSPVPVVIHVSWSDAGRYVVIRPGSSMVVDIVRAPRAPVISIDILGMDCLVITQVTAEFGEGGVVTMQADGTATYVPGRQDPRTAAVLDEANVFTTCAEAVAAAGT